MVKRTLGKIMAQQLKSNFAKMDTHNWLNDDICGKRLNQIGFATVKEEGRFIFIGHAKPNPDHIDNIDGDNVIEAYHYKPLDLVVIKEKHTYQLALDSCLDSFWKGDIVKMRDVVAVMCLLSK